MTSTILRLPRFPGRLILGFLSQFGRISLLVVELVRGLSEVRIWVPRTFTEAASVGAGSLPIVLVIAIFAGVTTAFQAGYQWQSNLPVYVLGTLIVETIVLELGPVLIGLVLAGRIGARYAAELGTMRVTEQIDALESLGRSPASHLIIPRVLASTLMLPVLVVIADVVAIGSGLFSVKQVLPVTDADFAYGAKAFWKPFDAYYSLIKATSFGFAIGLISCYMGFNTKQGAERVRGAMPTAARTTDIIVGFPGETEDDFQQTLDVVRQARFASAFTFQYSKRPGTPAAEMDGQVPKDVVQERYLRLTALQDEISWAENRALVGRKVELLVAAGEGSKDAATGRLSGRARDGRLVHFTAADGVRPGDVVETVVTDAKPHFLVADGALLSHRRTRAGDASEAGVRPTTSGVLLGMPRIGAPAALAPAGSC